MNRTQQRQLWRTFGWRGSKAKRQRFNSPWRFDYLPQVMKYTEES